MIDSAIIVAESFIERVADRDVEASLREALATSHELISELAADVERLEECNARLQEEFSAYIDRVEFSGGPEKAPVTGDDGRPECTCGGTFRSAEDYRDHLSCERRESDAAIVLSSEERRAIAYSISLMDQDHVADHAKKHSGVLEDLVRKCGGG